jgi:hypothetical protein
MVTGGKTHRVIELLRELRAHALWDGLKELFHWETFKDILKYLGTIGGLFTAGIQWMGHHLGLLFVFALVVGGFSLFTIGLAVGRKPSEIEIQPPQSKPTEIVEQTQPKPTTVRFIEEESKSVDSATRTSTTTRRKIVEVVFTIAICAGAGFWLSSNIRELPTAAIVTNEPATNAAAYPTPAPNASQGSGALIGALIGSGSASRATNTTAASTTTSYPDDPDYPVWALTNYDYYVCFGPEWQRTGRRLPGTWMKQSEASHKHKAPLQGWPCGTGTDNRMRDAEATQGLFGAVGSSNAAKKRAEKK